MLNHDLILVNYILWFLISELRWNAQVPTGLVNLANVFQMNYVCWRKYGKFMHCKSNTRDAGFRTAAVTMATATELALLLLFFFGKHQYRHTQNDNWLYLRIGHVEGCINSAINGISGGRLQLSQYTHRVN